MCVLTSVKGMSSLSCVWPQQSVFSKQVEQCMSESPPQSGSSRDCHSEREREKKTFYVSIQNKAIFPHKEYYTMVDIKR